ncbi:hypothetical protein NDU88_003074 [Pleurodeles waltl]|uniref:Uncharacterized protein n=1 Tax=Pleurodeles waltl TaxID=8319 RepID=A0AAV7NJL5_PLEWA|nr:hypothetical protein NDU88_003074 [Pleurodeles waltl]
MCKLVLTSIKGFESRTPANLYVLHPLGFPGSSQFLGTTEEGLPFGQSHARLSRTCEYVAQQSVGRSVVLRTGTAPRTEQQSPVGVPGSPAKIDAACDGPTLPRSDPPYPGVTGTVGIPDPDVIRAGKTNQLGLPGDDRQQLLLRAVTRIQRDD